MARTRSSASWGAAVPSLVVDDVSGAAAFYEETLRFTRTVVQGHESDLALLRRGEAALVLHCAATSSGPYSYRSYAPGGVDAVVAAEDIGRIGHRLQVRGEGATDAVSSAFPRAVELVDPAGNVVLLARAGDVGASAACLAVRSVSDAIREFRDVFGFELVRAHGDPPASALVRRDAAVLLLQEIDGPGEDASRRRHGQYIWDVLLLVDDPAALYERFAGRGARIARRLLPDPIADRTFEVLDSQGNVLCFGQLPAAGVRGVGRRVVGRLPSRVRRDFAVRRSAVEERLHLAEFRTFYESLPDKRSIFYMLFGGDLLHWLAQAEQHVPRSVNLVLVGTGLRPAEEAWVRENLARPFHHVRLGVDIMTSWDFLFAVNRESFGWLDIDCFVLNDRLFGEMAAVAPDVAVNCTWSYDSGFGFRLAQTHFLFVNAACTASLREAGVPATPYGYDWSGEFWRVVHARQLSRHLSRRQQKLLLDELPADARGRPRPPAGNTFFDTLVVYQVLARRAGFRVHCVRDLIHHTASELAELRDPPPWQQDWSDELVHASGISYLGRFAQEPGAHALYLAADYAVLVANLDRLPGTYDRRASALEQELARLGVTADRVPHLLHDHLVGVRGLRPETVARALGAAGRRDGTQEAAG